MAGNKKKLILLLILPILIAVSIGTCMWNKGPVNVTRKKGVAVDPVALYDLYIKDSASANLKFTDKILEISGVVSGISVPYPGDRHVLLKTGMEGASINCALADSTGPLPAVGSSIVIKGICSGIQSGDPDLGIMGDVILSRCRIINK